MPSAGRELYLRHIAHKKQFSSRPFSTPSAFATAFGSSGNGLKKASFTDYFSLLPQQYGSCFTAWNVVDLLLRFYHLYCQVKCTPFWTHLCTNFCNTVKTILFCYSVSSNLRNSDFYRFGSATEPVLLKSWDIRLIRCFQRTWVDSFARRNQFGILYSKWSSPDAALLFNCCFAGADSTSSPAMNRASRSRPSYSARTHRRAASTLSGSLDGIPAKWA